jgi:hypothetical protein
MNPGSKQKNTPGTFSEKAEKAIKSAAKAAFGIGGVTKFLPKRRTAKEHMDYMYDVRRKTDSLRQENKKLEKKLGGL